MADKNISSKKIAVISYWLKDQIEKTRQRDLLDALIDAEMLVRILEQRCIVAGIRVGIENHD